MLATFLRKNYRNRTRAGGMRAGGARRLGRARGRNFGWRMQNEGCREGVCAFGRGVRAGRAGIGRAMRKGERVRIAPTNVAEFDPPHSPKKRCTFWVKPPESFFNSPNVPRIHGTSPARSSHQNANIWTTRWTHTVGHKYRSDINLELA